MGSDYPGTDYDSLAKRFGINLTSLSTSTPLPRDEDLAVRTIIGEAKGEGAKGWQAVAGVIRNRAKASGQTFGDVVLAKNQFEPWSSRRKELESYDPNSPIYQQVAKTILPVLRGESSDPTGGATHFYSPKAQSALGRSAPSWDNGKGVDIGNHRFFKLGYSGKGLNGTDATSATPQIDYNTLSSQFLKQPNYDALSQQFGLTQPDQVPVAPSGTNKPLMAPPVTPTNPNQAYIPVTPQPTGQPLASIQTQPLEPQPALPLTTPVGAIPVQGQPQQPLRGRKRLQRGVQGNAGVSGAQPFRVGQPDQVPLASVPMGHTEVNVGAEDLPNPIEAQPQQVIHTDQQAQNAVAEVINFPSNIKTVNQAKAYAKKQLQAKYPTGNFDQLDFTAPWTAKNRQTQISYGTLQQAGIDTTPLTEQKRVENRVENAQPNLQPVDIGGISKEDVANAINEHARIPLFGYSAAPGAMVGEVAALPGDLSGIAGGILQAARDLSPSNAIDEILTNGGTQNVKVIHPEDKVIGDLRDFYDSSRAMAAKTGEFNPDGTPTIPSQVFRIIGSTPKVAIVSAFPGGLIGGFAIEGAALSKLHGGTTADLAKQAAKGALTGAIFKFLPEGVQKVLGTSANNLLLRAGIEVPLLGGTLYGVGKLEGTPDQENLVNSLAIALFHGSGIRPKDGQVVHAADYKGNEVFAKIDGEKLVTVKPQKPDLEFAIPKPTKPLPEQFLGMDARNTGITPPREVTTNEAIAKSTAEAALPNTPINELTELPEIDKVKKPKTETQQPALSGDTLPFIPKNHPVLDKTIDVEYVTPKGKSRIKQMTVGARQSELERRGGTLEKLVRCVSGT